MTVAYSGAFALWRCLFKARSFRLAARPDCTAVGGLRALHSTEGG